MVETASMPDWVLPAIVIMGVLFLLSIVAVIVFQEKIDYFSATLSSIFVVFIVGIMGIFIMLTFLKEYEISNNPVNISDNEKSMTKINYEELKETIAEKTNSNSVKLGVISDEEEFMEKLSNSESVKFTTVKNGDAVDGSFYFTKDSMVIKLSSGDNNTETFEIPLE